MRLSHPGRLPVVFAVRTRKNPTRDGGLGLGIDPRHLHRGRSLLGDRRERRLPVLEAAFLAAAITRRGSGLPKRGHRRRRRRVLRPHRAAAALEERGEFHLPSAAIEDGAFLRSGKDVI